MKNNYIGVGNKHVNKKEFRENNVTESRLEFLAKKFNIYDSDDIDKLFAENKRMLELDPTSVKLVPIYATSSNLRHRGPSDDNIICVKKIKPSEKRGTLSTVTYLISDTVFADIIIADPTINKSNVQWMLQTFVNEISENVEAGIRFVLEDLGLANIYLTLFEANKKKKLFKEWANKNEFRKWSLNNPNKTIHDWNDLNYNPSDITQYKSLSQLFDAVDPFRERSHSDLEDAMNRFVNLGEATIEYRDRFWTVYIPKTKSANCVMETFAGWCTAQPNQGMFDNYVNGNREPDGSVSKIYVIVNNKLFSGESDETYQIHFESSQIKDKNNGPNVDLYDLIFSKRGGSGIHEYFHAVLDKLARTDKHSITNNRYIDQLIEFGFTESLFDYLPDDTNSISINGSKRIPKIPDLSRFKEVDQLILINVGLLELNSSIGNLTNLQLLSLSNNNLTTLPSCIGKLKNLDIINIKGNKLTSIPDEIAELDKTRGGTLYRVSVDADDIGEELFAKLKRLLPSAIVG